jgi:hypothetical protein
MSPSLSSYLCPSLFHVGLGGFAFEPRLFRVVLALPTCAHALHCTTALPSDGNPVVRAPMPVPMTPIQAESTTPLSEGPPTQLYVLSAVSVWSRSGPVGAAELRAY